MKRGPYYLSVLVLILGAFAVANLISVSGARAVDGGVLTGKVMFEGTAPAPVPIRMDADPVCLLANKNGASAEEVLVNANGTLKNVFVYVKQGLEGQRFDTPTTPVTFDQKGCHYTPHVLGIRVNQPFEILNSDGTLHNIHALPKNSPEFNLGMPIQGMKLTQKFTAPEVMVKIKCEVHPWMAAYAGVLNHPFFAVTGDDGSFSLKGLPPGQYTIEAWHEKFGVQEATVKIPDQGEVNFTFKG